MFQWPREVGNTGKYNYVSVNFPLSYLSTVYYVNMSIYWNNSRDSIVDTNDTIKSYTLSSAEVCGYDSDNNNSCIFLLFVIGI